MKSLATDIRTLISLRLATAPVSEILSIASSLCANEPQIAPSVMHAAAEEPFTYFDKDGKLTLDIQNCVGWHDARSDLTWARFDLGSHTWQNGKKACADFRLFGLTDWRMPAVKELTRPLNYERFPAVDTNLFAGNIGYTWSDTPDAESPSDLAWDVFLQGGGVLRGSQSYQSLVRAVRAGQPLGLLG